MENKELKGLDKVQKVLELQEQGMTIRDIAIEVGHIGKVPEKGLKGFMKSYGYSSVNNIFPSEPDGKIRVKSLLPPTTETSGNTSNSITESDTSVDNCLHTCEEIGVTSDTFSNCVDKDAHNCADNKSNTFTPEQIEKLLQLVDNYDNIMSITSSNTSSNTIENTSSNIITPATYPIGVTIKVDGETWKRFKKYCKASDEKQQDLITTALNMLMKSNI